MTRCARVDWEDLASWKFPEPEGVDPAYPAQDLFRQHGFSKWDSLSVTLEVGPRPLAKERTKSLVQARGFSSVC
jgi:hypothetical protein